MNPIVKFDGAIAKAEQRIVGLLSQNIYLLIARVIFGFPLMMNGVGQLMMPELIHAQMELAGIDPVWAAPATIASLLGGLAILIGWRVRLAALLEIIYVVAATLMVHHSHTLLKNEVDLFEVPNTTISTMNMQTREEEVGPLRLPQYARDNCEWFVNDYRKVTGEVVSEDFILGCSLYRIEFDAAISMRHFTMFIPALLLFAAAGGGRFSLEAWLASKRDKA